MEKKITITIVAIVLIVLIGAIIWATMAQNQKQTAQKVTLTETGSTLLYPVFNVWAGNYTNATITTQATGSGTGISSAIKGTVIIGASDAFMPDSLVKQYPWMLNIPILISGQYVAYNIPGLNNIHLVLSGPVIAGIYNNTIQYWDDAKIKALNSNVTLPHERIIPVYRSDGSGDTNMFTLYLSRSSQWWNKTVGYGTNVNWPTNPAAHGATGNAGIVSFLNATPYSIGYVALTYQNDMEKDHLGYAALINRDGYAVLPSKQTIMNTASVYLNQIPPDGRINIAFAPGQSSYPIATFEYVIVNKTQASQQVANALKDFLIWAVSPNGGSSSQYLDQFNLVPLPSSVVNGVVIQLINKISGP